MTLTEVMTMELLIKDVKKTFSDQAVLKGINLHVKAHEFICILGHSGCGKSTLLNLIAGFTLPDSGTLTIEGKAINGPDQDRGIVFQEHALFPWYTVLENIEFGPIVQGKSKEEARRLAMKYLTMIGLEHCASHYPSELSGGMKQRVGIARALAGEPKLLLMDEPFAALDVFTKETMRKELIDIWSTLKTTIVFITHDIAEAAYLADRVIVMKNGGTAREIPVELPRPRRFDQPGFGKLVADLESILVN